MSDASGGCVVSAIVPRSLSRKEKRKNLKKLRRKEIRREAAEKEKFEELARLQDAAEQLRIQEEEKLEAERLEKERLEHDEQEKLFHEREKKAQEEFERKQTELLQKEEQRKLQQEDHENWNYVEDDGPAEIIWQGNEIIVRKKRVKVPAEHAEQLLIKNPDNATSNPLPPQSTAFSSHKYPPPSTPDGGEPNPMFGTEQDKTHCPFHIKTGVCRFGVRCSRVHVYPDQSFTLLMRNMYTGPGLSWDHDEGLESSSRLPILTKIIQSLSITSTFKEGGKLFWRPDEGTGISAFDMACLRCGEVPPFTLVDEEVAEQYEEFYDDVHSEFLQHGELVNFKVCKNGSSHLRGNVYVHYQTEAGAQAAYNAMNGRFYAGKQITCEFVGVTRWRVALCGEYMKGHHKPCSHGTACNFLHCFRNPRGEYDWADWDSPPPRYWARKMAKLFGYELDHREDDDSSYEDSRRRNRSSERARSTERGHRRDDRHSRFDDHEYSSRYRERRRHRSREKSHQSSPDDFESSCRNKRHRRHRRSSPVSTDERRRRRDSGEEEKGRRYHKEIVQEEAVSRSGDGLENTDRDSKFRRDYEVDADDADELHCRSRRKRSTTPSEDHSKHESKSRLLTRNSFRDVQAHDYLLSSGYNSRKGRWRSGSSEDVHTVQQTSEPEDETERICRKGGVRERERSKSRHSSKKRSSMRRDQEGDSNDDGTYTSSKTSKSEHKGDSKRKLHNEKHRNDPVGSKFLEQEDRWSLDVDTQ